jgi:hypothetical protein
MSDNILTYDLSKFEKEMDAIPQTVMRGARKGLGNFLETVQIEARQTHRHHRITGMLEKSIIVSIVSINEIDELYGCVRFEEAVVDYGKWVHEGHGAPGKSVLNGYPYVWDPDQFIYEAFGKLKDRAFETIETGINMQIKQDMKS